jgi:hypothetical protein
MKAIYLVAAVMAAALTVSGVRAADVSISQAGNSPIFVGSNAAITLLPVNVGAQAIVAGDTVTVTESLPGTFSQMSASGISWSCSTASGPSISCTRNAPLAAGQSFPPINISAHANMDGKYQLCAHIKFIPTPTMAKEEALANNDSCFRLVAQQPQLTQVCMQQVTGTGAASSQSFADSNAKNDWSNKTSSYDGAAFADWSKATQKSVSCNQTGDGFFGYTTHCTYSGKPCSS